MFYNMSVFCMQNISLGKRFSRGRIFCGEVFFQGVFAKGNIFLFNNRKRLVFTCHLLWYGLTKVETGMKNKRKEETSQLKFLLLLFIIS